YSVSINLSGANCAVVVGAVLLLLRFARAGPRTAAAVAVVALGGFVLLARPSPSVLRAAVMGAVALAGLASGRSHAAVPALAVPAVAPATVLGVVATLLSPLWPVGAQMVVWLAAWPSWWLVIVARFGAQAPAAMLPWPAGIGGGLLMAALLTAGLLASRHRW